MWASFNVVAGSSCEDFGVRSAKKGDYFKEREALLKIYCTLAEFAEYLENHLKGKDYAYDLKEL